jgi:hypothetical protein
MKKISFCLMALALAASTMFTSCGDDDDDNDDKNFLEQINSINASVKDGAQFSTSTAAFYQAASNMEETGTSKLSDFFSGSINGATTIIGTSNGKQVAINIKGTTTDTYELNLGLNDDVAIANAIVTVLGGGSVKDAIQNAVKTDALIIYRASGDDEKSSTYYMSSKATVTANFDLLVYSSGTFSATMVNPSKDTFQMTGQFKVFGKPTVKTSSK